jgi:hypothetical protein
VTVSWSPVTRATNGAPLMNLSGYRLYFGPSPDALTSSIEIANPTAVTHVVPNLLPGFMYFAATAYTSDGVESNLSTVVGTTLSASP